MSKNKRNKTVLMVMLIALSSAIFISPVVAQVTVSIENASAGQYATTAPLISAKAEPEKLESALYQLTQTQNHDEFAKTRGLHLEDGTVRVVIELHNASDTIPDGYGATVETRHENLVQALVPVNSLIELTKEPSINFIRAPLPRQAGEKEEKDTNNSDTGADADKSVPGFTLIMTILVLITVFTLILYKNKIFVYRRERGER